MRKVTVNQMNKWIKKGGNPVHIVLACGLRSLSIVSLWKSRGEIPARYHPALGKLFGGKLLVKCVEIE